jgi:hypothetical protein
MINWNENYWKPKVDDYKWLKIGDLVIIDDLIDPFAEHPVNFGKESEIGKVGMVTHFDQNWGNHNDRKIPGYLWSISLDFKKGYSTKYLFVKVSPYTR